MVCHSFIQKEEVVCRKCESGKLIPSICFKETDLKLCSKVKVGQVLALFPYEEKYKKAVHRWKYKGVRKYAKGFASLLAEQILLQEEALPDYLVPVPLARDRYANRGFNQSYDLAKQLSVGLGIPLTNHLIRHKKTKPQVECNKKERLTNVSHSMGFDSKFFSKKVTKIALIDDIYTTGSTINECIRAILKEKKTEIDLDIEIWVVCKAN
jgi:ComF family protein